MYFAVKLNSKYLLEILTSVVLLPPQDDGFGGFFLNTSFRQSERREQRGIYNMYLAVKVNSNHKLEILMSGPPRARRASCSSVWLNFENIISPILSFRQRNRKVSTRNLEFILRSQVELKVPTGDPNVGPPRAGRASYSSVLTEFWEHHSPNLVIPTEKPIGFDEESTVGTSQSSGTRIIHCRSSRRSFYSLLRMTVLTD